MDKDAWRRAGMFVRYFNKPFIPQDDDQQYAFDAVNDFITEMKSDPGAGVLLSGPPGTGKTHLAHHILESAHDQGLGPVRATSLAEIVRWHQEKITLSRLLEFDEDSANRYLRIEKTLRNLEEKYRYVLLDDVGKEYTGPTNWAQLQLNSLVRSRGNMLKPVIITTNAVPKELGTIYGDHMWSYLKEICRIVPLTGRDHRGPSHA